MKAEVRETVFRAACGSPAVTRLCRRIQSNRASTSCRHMVLWKAESWESVLSGRIGTFEVVRYTDYEDHIFLDALLAAWESDDDSGLNPANADHADEMQRCSYDLDRLFDLLWFSIDRRLSLSSDPIWEHEAGRRNLAAGSPPLPPTAR